MLPNVGKIVLVEYLVQVLDRAQLGLGHRVGVRLGLS